MLNKIKIVELFKKKKLLLIIYRGKEKNILLANTKKSSAKKRVRKSKGLINLRELVVEP